MDPLQVRRQDAGVNLGGGKGQVAEQLLDVAHTRAAFEHLGGARVSQAVRRRGGRQARRLGVAADDPAQHGGREAAARVVDEEAVHRAFAVRAGQQRGPDLRHVVAQVSGGGAPDWNDAVAIPFALEHAQSAVFEVDVVDGQPGEFETAQARGVEQFENGPVAVAARGGHVGLRQQPHDLFVAQHALGQVPGLVERGKVFTGIDEDFPAFVQEGEERFDDPHLPVAVSNRGRPALLGAPGGQRAVVIEEVLQADIPQILVRAGLAVGEPSHEQAQRMHVMAHARGSEQARFEVFAVEVEKDHFCGSGGGEPWVSRGCVFPWTFFKSPLTMCR